MKTECGGCGVEFAYMPRPGGQPRYCSTECRRRSRSRQLLEYRESNREKIRIRHTIQQRERRTGDIKGTLRIMLSAAKGRAKQKNLDFDLSLDYVVKRLDTQHGLCCKTGVELTPCAGRGTGARLPSTVSIDRIDNNQGYTKDNIQLVCWWYNVSKANWTEQDMMTYATAYITRTCTKP